MLLNTNTAELEARLAGLDPANIVSVKDFDLTLALKPARNFHYVKLDEDQRSVLEQTAKSFGASIILTARGEDSTLSGIFGEKAGFNITVASNCGHHVLLDASKPNAQRLHIPLADETAEAHFPRTITAIYDLLHKVGLAFDLPQDTKLSNRSIDLPINGHAMLTLDPRERCGAWVFENTTPAETDALFKQVETAFAQLDPAVAQNIYKVEKRVPFGDNQVNGYIDIKPAGMSKGATVLTLLANDHFKDRITDKTTFLVAGDSAPDLEMMQAITTQYGKDRTINIWVGDDKAAQAHVEKFMLPIYNLQGRQDVAIPEFYRMLRTAAKPASRQSGLRLAHG